MSEKTEPREVTLDGIDPYFDEQPLQVPRINLLTEMPTAGTPLNKRRRTVTRARHGDKVTLLERHGDWCLVQHRKGAKTPRRGWVSFRLILELKGEWMEERRTELAEEQAQTQIELAQLDAMSGALEVVA